MSDPAYPIIYDAPPGITLRKAQHPQGDVGALKQEQSGMEYARAPESSGQQALAGRPPATQRNIR